MHVDLDAFYASVEQLRRPELRGRPVIVGWAGVAGERGVVAAASYEARPFGVRSAMPLSRARRLCPTAIFVPCDFPAYREASKSVFAILDRYSPVIEPIALDEAYLDLTGEEALMGPTDRVAHRLRDEVKSRCGLDLSIGVASCKLVAKVASELRKPRGLLQDVGPSLRAHGLSARTVVLKIRYQPFDPLSRQATLPYPTDRDDQLASALRHLLETQLDPSRAVRLIGAGVSNLEPCTTQLSLLETRSSRLAMLDEQLDELRGRYGDHVITRGTAERLHQKDVRRDDLDALR